MGHSLCAGAELEHRKNFRARINGQPQPEHLCGAAQPGAQFVQLQVWEQEMAEAAFVQGLGMLPGARQPSRDRGLSVAEDAFSRGRVQPFGQRRQHHGDLVGGRFQPVQGRVMSSAEGGAARLTAKGLDALGSPMLAIADERMPVGVSVAEVCALPVGTGEAFGGYTLRSSPAAFHLAPGAHRSRYWSCTQRASGGMSTDGAIVGGARLEQTMERRAHRGLCSGLHKTRMGPAKGTRASPARR